MSNLAGLFPNTEQREELLQRAGWVLVACTGKMAAIRKDESGEMLPWDQAWARGKSERAEAKRKGRR